MSEINFLSDAFVREQGRRARIHREVVVVVIVALTLGAWGLTSWRQLAKSQTWLESKQVEADSLGTQMTQIASMTEQFNQLKHQVRVQNELTLPLDLTAVIATLGQTMNDSLTITEMSITSTTPKPILKSNRPKKDAQASPAAQPPRESQVMRIEIVGLSPTDGDVADFVEKLTDHAIFSAVKMHYTRPTRISNVAARKFRIELEVSLDRRYLPDEEQAHAVEEVAHAG